MSDILEIDLDKKLEIEINNENPVSLKDLSLSLLSFNHQFHKFVEAETENGAEMGAELLIKEVRKGSIVIELVSQVSPIVPLLWEGGTLSQWSSVVQGVYGWLLGKIENPPREVTKQDLQEWNKFVEPVVKDHGSQMNINVSDGGTVVNNFTISSTEANAIQNEIGRKIEQLDEPEDHIHRRKVMYWYQAKFDPHSETGNRAIIDDLSKKSMKVIFENNAVKEEMLHPADRFKKQWHELAYVVDIEVETVRGVPKMYKVLRYYPEYTFDPEEE